MRNSALFPAVLLFGLAPVASGSWAAEIPSGLVNSLKPTVVNIEASVQHGLNSESPGKHKGTGFIVDGERGIIATNRHVAGTSPGPIKIVFEDGETAQARRWYYDSWHDFALLRLEPLDKKWKLKAVTLGDSAGLKEQDDVVMIGNNDVQEYSIKFGKTANLHLCRGDRHTSTIQTTFDRAGGSSGSPVFNDKGEVVAIHFAGTDTTSFEMRVEYLKDALAALTAGGPVRRGDVGLDLDTMLLSDAQKHFRFPPALAAEVSALRKDLKRVAYVEQTIPQSPAAARLRAGDIILKADGRWIGDDVHLFDKVVDKKVGSKVAVTVVRAGRTIEAELPVADAQRHKVRSFALFAGGALQDVTPEQRNNYNIAGDGVFLTQAEKGSSMAGLGREGSHSKYIVVIEGINGSPTRDLASFIEAAKGFRDGDQIYVSVEDRWVTQSTIQARPVRLDLKYFPLKIFDWSEEKLEWVQRP